MSDTAQPLSWLDGEKVIPPEAKADVTSARGMTTLSADAFKKNYPHYVVQLSPRRQGAQLKNVLAVINGTATHPPQKT